KGKTTPRRRLTFPHRDGLCPDIACEVTCLKSVEDTLAHAAGIINSNGVIIHCSGQCAALVNGDPQSVAGLRLEDILDPVPEEEFPCLVVGEYRPKACATLLWKTRAPKIQRWLKLTLREINEIGHSCGCFSFDITDVTAVVHKYNRFCADHGRLESMHEASQDGLVVHVGEEIVDVNPAFERMFGYSLEEAIGMSILALVAPESVPSVLSHVAEKSNDLYEGIGRRKDGSTFILQVNAREHKFRGRYVRVASVMDITAFREAEQKLVEAYRTIEADRTALQEKNAALREVLHQIDHSKQAIRQQIQGNIDRVALPTLHTLRQRLADSDQVLADLVEKCLADVSAPFINTVEQKFASLTSRELNICNMIRNDMSSKEIAKTLNTSEQTVIKQRKSIRRKMGIAKENINLAVYLKSLV
ncbi:MAG: PAS domain S-box protein, partial [candidate division Zixibacteria bacterium]|nr:PAS domain S-box protein [candidate division Zixibacteria bacterium]